MSLSIIHSRAGVGTDAPIVRVEVHLSRGLPSCSIVGLPATAVKESRDRVRGAIINAGFEFPRQRITVNLAPADLPKEGGRFDLPIALGILIASGQVKCPGLDNMVFLGELALSGELRPIKGPLIAALALRGSDKILVLPRQSANEAALVKDIEIRQADNLHQLCAGLNGLEELSEPDTVCRAEPAPQADFSDVIGHPFAKWALEVAAAGHHSLLMTGAPGAGKTMLASRIGGILPALDEQDALQIAAITSLSSQGFDVDKWMQRPFRAPHHSASGAAIIGGGSNPAPGEVSLAHNGVLFLDELPEFQRHVLELLREPMESGEVHISRARRQCRFLAKFLLIAAANPCPCGYLGNPDRCQCPPDQVSRYRSRISGPLLDRIDMHLGIVPVGTANLFQRDIREETSKQIRIRVEAARQKQLQRQGRANGELDAAAINQVCALSPQQAGLLAKIIEQTGISTRGCHRILKLARTVADLAGHDEIEEVDLLQGIKLRGATRHQADQLY